MAARRKALSLALAAILVMLLPLRFGEIGRYTPLCARRRSGEDFFNTVTYQKHGRPSSR
jgi:hypothetical protein